jgi:leucyl/phenylalanyl-tRNA---protein transferase
MTIYITELSAKNHSFPSVLDALDEPNGLLAFGGDLNPQRIIQAYKQGIFPWYGINEPILWWSPTPRAIFIPQTFHPSRSLKKFQRKVMYRISINQATERVIDFCASTRTPEQTWLHDDMRRAYKELAELKICHSVEVWDNEDALIGGLYGVSLGRIFCGESMFSLKTNASKIALWAFCEHFARHHGELIDCQVMNSHLKSLGAIELKRSDFMSRLNALQDQSPLDNCFSRQWLTLAI